MAKIQRYENCGAVFTDDLCCLNQWQKRGGTVNGSGTTIVKSPLGKATNFNGSGYLSLPARRTEAQNIGTSDFSVCAWVKNNLNADTYYTVISNKTNVSATTVGWLFGLRMGAAGIGVALNINDGSTANDISIRNTTDRKTLLSDNNWHFICATIDRNGDGIIYIDNFAGESTAISTMSNTLNNTQPLIIGDVNATGYKFTGSIKNVMVFKKILTNQEISAIFFNKMFNYDKYLVSKWNMDDINPRDSGNKKLYISGIGVNLDSTNIVNGQNSKYKAISFNGTDEKITLSSSPNVTYTGDYSISAWLNATNTNAGSIVNFTNSTNDRNGIILSGGKIFGGIYTGSYSAYSSNTITANKWYNVVFNNNNKTMSLYVNGISYTTATSSLLDANASVIGYNNSASYFNGKISEIKVYNTSLLPIQVLDLYNQGK